MDKRRLFRWIVYFRRGHQSYFAMLLSLMNFVVIQYKLLIENVPWLRNIFTSLVLFTTIFIVIYVPIAIIVGWMDTWRMTKPREFETNPYFYKPTAKEREIYAEFFLTTLSVLEKISDGEDRERILSLKRKIRRWIEEGA